MEYNAIDKIRIDGINYTVTTETGKKLQTDWGSIDFDSCEITIRKTNPAQWLQTLWHEIIHHADFAHLGSILNEAQVNSLASTINAVLLDNPNLSLEIWQVANGGEFTQEEDEPDTDDVELDLVL